MGQLAKQLAENSSGGFGANTEKNRKEECKVVMTRSKREIIVEDESRTNEEKELGAEGEKENEENQMEERKINEDKEEKNEKKCKKER